MREYCIGGQIADRENPYHVAIFAHREMADSAITHHIARIQQQLGIVDAVQVSHDARDSRLR